jgi:hypothetical protein
MQTTPRRKERIAGNTELLVLGTFLLDSTGLFPLSHADVDYTRRLNPDDPVRALKALKTAKPMAATEQLHSNHTRKL